MFRNVNSQQAETVVNLISFNFIDSRIMYLNHIKSPVPAPHLYFRKKYCFPLVVSDASKKPG